MTVSSDHSYMLDFFRVMNLHKDNPSTHGFHCFTRPLLLIQAFAATILEKEATRQERVIWDAMLMTKHAVPHLEGLDSGLEPSNKHGHGSNFTQHRTNLKSTHLTS